MIDYNLGEMKSADGSVLWYEVQKEVSQHAIAVSNLISRTPIFEELKKKIPSSRVLLYYQYVIKKEIFPFIRQACVSRCLNQSQKKPHRKKQTLKLPSSGVFPLLKECWKFKEAQVELIDPLIFSISKSGLSAAGIKSNLKGMLLKKYRTLRNPRDKRHSMKRSLKGWTLACHYAEGFDPSKRNDLNWYFGSGIDPQRVLIYFDSRNNSNRQLIRAEEISKVEKNGFNWVALKKNIIEAQGNEFWEAEDLDRKELLPKAMAKKKDYRWILEIGNELLEQVHYWKQFYDAFNVKVNYVPEEGFSKNIAQAIAFDVDKKDGGVLIGKQRSEIYMPFVDLFVGFHPKHIFFVWNDRIGRYLSPNNERIKTLVVTGYPNDVFIKKGEAQKLRDQLEKKGVKFIVALFDNAFGPDIRFSENKMEEFYRMFLWWALEDKTVGLIIKSKKPLIIGRLTSIRRLFDSVMETGRCIRLGEEWGRFPADASLSADMAVGVGIASAVIESVIAGRRGIHYDNTYFRDHEFYNWGKGRVIFDDPVKMMAALKRYKEDPVNDSTLGDWSEYLDKLDPFCDGKGGERMGTYMRWLLEAFDSGKDRDAAIVFANEQYAKQWGEDKVIDMRHRNAQS